MPPPRWPPWSWTSDRNPLTRLSVLDAGGSSATTPVHRPGFYSVRRRRSPLNGGNVNRILGALYPKENAPTADTAAKSGIGLQIFYVTRKWVRFHLAQGGAYASLVPRRNPFKRLLRGPGEDDAPSLLFGGVHVG